MPPKNSSFFASLIFTDQYTQLANNSAAFVIRTLEIYGRVCENLIIEMSHIIVSVK